MMFAWQKKFFGLSFVFLSFFSLPPGFVLLKGSNILHNFLVYWWYSESINESSCCTKDTEQFYFIIGCRKWSYFAFPALTVVFGFQSLHQYKESKSQGRYKKQWRDMKTNNKVGSRQIYTKVQVTVMPLSPCVLSHHPQILHIEEAINIWETGALSAEKTSVELCIYALHLIN